MLNILAVFLGGGLGAVCRYLLTTFSIRFSGVPHWGTFSANIAGCFLIGYIFGLTEDKFQGLPPAIKLFLTAGFLGGLTTFSTFSCESFCMLREGKILHCCIYIIASLTIGLSATYAGFLLSR